MSNDGEILNIGECLTMLLYHSLDQKAMVIRHLRLNRHPSLHCKQRLLSAEQSLAEFQTLYPQVRVIRASRGTS